MSEFIRAIRRAVASALGLTEGTEVPVVAPPDRTLGDYAVAMFPFAKSMRAAPAALAQKVAAAFAPGDGLVSATAAGPYVNFRVDRAGFLRALLARVESEGAEFGGNRDGGGRTVVIDLSSPNISKHLAYHHIRSTMIGHSLRRIWRANGWTAIGFNFLGDWGTTHGMLLAAWTRWGAGVDLAEDGVTKLNELYVRFRAEMKKDASLDAEARAWFKRLEQGDA